jgi:cytochrome c-type biogenesis protein CcmH
VTRALVLLVSLLAATAFGQEATKAAASADPAFVVGAPKGVALSGPALETRTEEVASLLRCPVCQGLSVADSPASMAINMKAEVGALLSKGYTEDQVLAYFEQSYGEFVRLKPPLRGVNWLVWLGPLAALLAGGLVVVAALRNSKQPEEPSPGPLPGRDSLPDDPRLAAAVLKVRELAYGWPGGKAPGAPAS